MSKRRSKIAFPSAPPTLPAAVYDFFDTNPTQSALCLNAVYPNPKDENYQRLFAIALKTAIWPVLKKEHTNQRYSLMMDRLRTVNREWKFYGKTISQCPPGAAATVITGIWFVQFPEPDGECIGFLCPSSSVYQADEHKDDVRHAQPSSVDHSVMVQGSQGKTWTVLFWEDGRVTCNCPSWIYQGGLYKGCKHTKLAQVSNPTP